MQYKSGMLILGAILCSFRGRCKFNGQWRNDNIVSSSIVLAMYELTTTRDGNDGYFDVENQSKNL